MLIEDEVKAVLASLDGQGGNAQAKDSDSSAPGGQGEPEEIKRVIHVDKYPLPDGSALYRLPTGQGCLSQVTLPLRTIWTETPWRALRPQRSKTH